MINDSSLEAFYRTLEEERSAYALPNNLREQAERFAKDILGLLFVQHETPEQRTLSLPNRVARIGEEITSAVAPLMGDDALCTDILRRFKETLPHLRESMLLDAKAILANDPAAITLDEVILSYPGFYAIALYRIANAFHHCGIPIYPRLLSEFAHRVTGIDIHPGATIGKQFSIDHGTGIVIGETTIIGDRVRIFQGVTLGALAVKKELASVKRHPTLGDDVVVYANATILGGKTVVGQGSIIGGNVWLTQSVPPQSIVTENTTLKKPGEAAEALLDYYL